MRKIAILTQPLKANYGGIIQNYALQTVLQKCGCEVETISREYHRDASGFRVLLANLKNETVNRLMGRRKKIFTKAEANEVFAENLRFINSYLHTSEKLFSTEELHAYFKRKDFDIAVVGSDQTWRPKYSPGIYNYFFDFLTHDRKIKKVAYASSFGTEKWEYTEEETHRCKVLIKQFDAVSVRELSGISLCADFLDAEAELVLDPTLLLTKEKYMELFGSVGGKSAGMCNYVLDRDTDKQLFISRLADLMGMDLFTNQPGKAIEKGLIYDFSNIADYKYPSLEGWLKSFYDADFVVTDSFHGTVFSILFNKPFLSIVNEERGASRFHSLLKMFGLEKRLVRDVRTWEASNLNEPIDYKRVNIILDHLRQESYLFISKNIVNV